MDQCPFRIALTPASETSVKSQRLPVDAVPVAKECERQRARLPPAEVQSTQIDDMRRDLRCKLRCTDLRLLDADPHHKQFQRPMGRQTRSGWANPEGF